jgi:hypothetical protein
MTSLDARNLVLPTDRLARLQPRSRAGVRAPVTTLVAALLAAALPLAPAEGQTGSLFPEPFRVEHHAEIDHGDGEVFVGDTVVDTYGGSWIVSERSDGRRLILDLARRELTEVRPSSGTYSTLAFGRLAEVSERLRLAQGLLRPEDLRPDDAASTASSERAAAGRGRRDAGSGAAGTDDPAAAELVVVDVAGGSTAGGASRTTPNAGPVTGLSGAGGTLRHLRVTRRDGAAPAAALEVWVDPSLRLTPAALEALESFEAEVLGVRLDHAGAAGAGTDIASAARELATAPGRFLAAARRQSGGAFPVRTVRPLVSTPDRAALAGVEETPAAGRRSRLTTTAEPRPLGSVADVVTRLERLDRFPSELLQIPDGLRRVPHPLEVTASYLEDERERDAALAGNGATPTVGPNVGEERDR